MVIYFHYGMWLSLVERCVRDAKAAGSNPVIPTKMKTLKRGFFRFLLRKLTVIENSILTVFRHKLFMISDFFYITVFHI